MEDQREGEGQQEEVHRNRSVRHGPTTERSGNNSEPVRSRWTPKPEQILILESIFNSGMVNPPKEETVRIRKLLEKFGSVGDANVFYWFQNRRSRSRRRQRQMQAASAQLDPPTTQLQPHHQLGLGVGAAIPFQYDANNSASMPMNMMPYSASFPTHLSASGGSSSDSCANDNNMFPLPQPQEPPLDASALFSSVSPHISFPDLMDQTSPPSSSFYPPPSPTTSSFGYHSGLITVFINGVATEVPRGPMDFKTMFGQDVVLVHSSGIPLPTNDFGFLMHTLQHGESYFLVPKPT